MVSAKRQALSARFTGLKPASAKASRLAAKSSRKTGTACEAKLARHIRKLGFKFRRNVSSLPGCPDFVFDRERVAVFADGDFWHGRRLQSRLEKLAKGHNSQYWIRKIQLNVARDRRVRRRLRTLGWSVIRVWEGDINANIAGVTARVRKVLQNAP